MTKPQAQENPRPERIAKRIAQAGVCSRREAEKLIAQGRVSIDGITITSPALNVTSQQRIAVDGEALKRDVGTVRLWKYHKPAGLITTHHDPEGRPTVFAALPPELPRVVSVGRLDINTEGLLLLTNDGAAAGRLEKSAWLRKYRVRVRGRVTEEALQRLRGGMMVDGVQYQPIEAELDREPAGSNSWVTLGLREGKNREIRRVMAALGYNVNRLIRLSYGPFMLGSLASGKVSEIPQKALLSSLPRED